MLKMFRWAALIAAIVFVVALAGAILSSQKSLEPSQQQTAEKNHKESSAEKNEITLFNRWFPDSTAVFSLFLVIFTGVLAFGGLIQLNLLTRAERIATDAANAAKESADVARDAVRLSANTAERQLRAYVALQSGSVVHAMVDNVQGFRVTVQLRNFGLTPAYSFTTWIMPPQIAAPDAIPFTPSRPLNERTGTSIIGPNSDALINWNAQFQPDDLEAIRAGTKAIFIWGGADYTDAFGMPRHFIFRERISGREDVPGGWALRPHPLGYEAN